MHSQSASTFQQTFPPALISIDHKTGGSPTQGLELTKKSEPSFSSFGIAKPSLKQSFSHISAMFINGLIKRVSVCTVLCVSER